MRKRLAVLISVLELLLVALSVSAPAESGTEAGAAVLSEDALNIAAADQAELSADSLSLLPMDDFSAFGPMPDENCFIEGKHIYSSENTFDDVSYIDQSIAVYAWHEWRENCCYSVARVRIADPCQLRATIVGDRIGRSNYVWVTARENNAVVATGGEFLAHAANKHVYAVRMGSTLRSEGKKNHDTLVTDQDGNFHILRGYSHEQREALENEGVQIVNLFNFGPALIIDGEMQHQDGEKISYENIAPNGLQPRTAIGQLGPLEYLMVVTNGRNAACPSPDGSIKGSKGCTIITLERFMASCNCVQAYALDGGNSAAMYFRGDVFSARIRRGVSDIVYFATLVDSGSDEPGEE
ncbi:MAG: phosphodiester glycosidase family protein [Clostridiales bacterium]|nr:phosphodiester glycosidase family protein [Clostridiales bacterium]